MKTIKFKFLFYILINCISIIFTHSVLAQNTEPVATSIPEASKSILNDDLVDDEDSATPLNKDSRLDSDDQISKVFRNMVVVQRKAKNKAKSFLFTTIMGFDFSDGPATFYTLNTNFGYAINDFWEVYINYVPQFYVIERGIVKKVAALELADPNKKAAIEYVKPKNQVGVEILWAPAYGKDSWGPYSIIRSDTFFKIGMSQTKFENGQKGTRYALMGGKTFFVAKYFNTRVAGGFHHMQTFVDKETKFNTLLFLEGGFVFYF